VFDAEGGCGALSENVKVSAAGVVAPPRPAVPVRLAARAGGRLRFQRGLIACVVFVLTWEAVGRFVLTGRYAFAPLSAILAEAARVFATGAIYPHIATSFLELLGGF
jgi:hypothetical protein